MTASPWHDIDIDERIFPLEVVVKATYWLSGRYDVDVRRGESEHLLLVRLRATDGILSAELGREAESRLRQDLIDFRTRALVDAETRTLRELLVAKAFDDHGDFDDREAR